MPGDMQRIRRWQWFIRLPDEKKLYTTIEELPQRMEQEEIHKTALIIVGNVLGEGYARSKLYDRSFTTEYRKGIQE